MSIRCTRCIVTDQVVFVAIGGQVSINNLSLYMYSSERLFQEAITRSRAFYADALWPLSYIRVHSQVRTITERTELHSVLLSIKQNSENKSKHFHQRRQLRLIVLARDLYESGKPVNQMQVNTHMQMADCCALCLACIQCEPSLHALIVFMVSKSFQGREKVRATR